MQLIQLFQCSKDYNPYEAFTMWEQKYFSNTHRYKKKSVNMSQVNPSSSEREDEENRYVSSMEQDSMRWCEHQLQCCWLLPFLWAFFIILTRHICHMRFQITLVLQVQEKWHKNQDINNSNGKKKSKLHQVKFRFYIRKSRFVQMVAKYWNELLQAVLDPWRDIWCV